MGKKLQVLRSGRRGTPAKWLIWLAEGMIIGAGAILPGISGGVLAVTFGIYRPLMATLSHPKDNLRRYWHIFLPLCIGFLLGFVVLAKAISAFFSADSNIAVCLFTGLVAGSLPQLFLEADKKGNKRADWIAFTITLMAAMFLVIVQYSNQATVSVTPNVFWYLFCGGLWGLSLVIPGMTSSAILIWLGLFQPMTDGISALDPAVLLPYILGIVLVVLLTARVVNAFFDRFYGIAYRMILAVVFASTLSIIPTSFSSVGEGILCGVVCAAGFIGAWAMDRYGKKPDSDAE